MIPIKKHVSQRYNQETIIQICLCLSGGLVLTLLAINQTVFNTDAASPFFQAKLITTGVTADPRELSFARIPSIFPDLANLISLTAISPEAGFEAIFPRYSIAIASLFLFIQSELIRLSLALDNSKAKVTLISLAITLYLASIFPEFRETIGLMITPLHHGGNIVCTYLFGCILVWNHFSNKPRVQHLRLGVAAITITIALSSNKLFLFTGLAPAAIACFVTRWTSIKDRSIVLILRKLRAKKESLIVLIIACGLGFAIPSILNGQCSLPIIIRIGSTYQELLGLIQSSQFFVTAILIGIISIAMLYVEACQLTQQEKTANQSLLLGVTFVLASSLSPLAYVWLLGEPKNLAVRYIIIMGPSLCTLIAITAVRSALVLDHFVSQKLEKEMPLYTLTLTSILFAFTLQKASITTWNPENKFRQYLDNHHSNASEIASIINQKGLKNGLSDFWGVKFGVLANISFKNHQPVSIEPIAIDGSPDLWATSVKQFFFGNKKLKSYDFVVTPNPRFEYGILDAYGTPSESISINSSKRKILIYRSKESQKRISKKLSKKLSTFRRQCNRNKPNFQGR